MITVRDAAYISLLKCEKNGSYTNIEVDSAIEKYGFTGSDRAFYTALVYGTIEKKITLDYIISCFSSRDIDKIDKEILVILRLGVYQILYMGGVADHAACNETVALCSRNKKKSASGFVNALLRETVRRKNDIPVPSVEDNTEKYLSVKYSFPEWLCEMWINDYGFAKCEAVLQALNITPDITLRVNTLKIDVDSVLNKLTTMGVNAQKGRYSSCAIRLLQNMPVSELDMLKDGLVFVQDEASQCCAAVLGADSGDTVVDTCSCPGGKSFSVAIGMENRGVLYSMDIHGNKLSLVKKGAKKLGIDIINTVEHDGSTFVAELAGKADRVLVDAPCSGLGVIAKKPDLRYKEKSSLDRLPEVQYKILDASSNYVKNGGVLVYSTCTLNKRENEEVVQRFLEKHKEFLPIDFSLDGETVSTDGMLTLYPDTHHTDGFFISKFIRK